MNKTWQIDYSLQVTVRDLQTLTTDEFRALGVDKIGLQAKLRRVSQDGEFATCYHIKECKMFSIA